MLSYWVLEPNMCGFLWGRGDSKPKMKEGNARAAGPGVKAADGRRQTYIFESKKRLQY